MNELPENTPHQMIPYNSSADRPDPDKAADLSARGSADVGLPLTPEERLRRRRRTTNTDNPEVARLRLQAMFDALPVPPGVTENDVSDLKRDVYAMIKDLAPRDESERQIVVHVVIAHFSTLRCFSHAWKDANTFELQRMYLDEAAKLADLHHKLLTTLDKRRGGGRQEVQVTYVHVADGGQAVVGDVQMEAAHDHTDGCDIQEGTFTDVSPDIIDQEVLPPDPLEALRPMAPAKKRTAETAQ